MLCVRYGYGQSLDRVDQEGLDVMPVPDIHRAQLSQLRSEAPLHALQLAKIRRNATF